MHPLKFFRKSFLRKTAAIEFCSRKNGGQNTSGPDMAKKPAGNLSRGLFAIFAAYVAMPANCDI